MNVEQQIFKKGSTTYYFSSKFFPKPTRDDVFKLYSFVRIADDFVDQVPADVKNFTKLKKTWQTRLKTKKVKVKKHPSNIDIVVENMYQLHKTYNFDLAWVDAFLESMNMDIKQTKYQTMDQTLKYIYGSAEVIGLMMSRIIGIDKKADKYAKYQGRAMQYINFIRDIAEDNELGRQYFPEKELNKFGLKSLSSHDVIAHPAEFREFIEAQVKRYYSWQSTAAKGFKYIPYNQRIAVRTAVDMYNWTAKKLAKDPFIVFDKKVKPSKVRVVGKALVRSIHA